MTVNTKRNDKGTRNRGFAAMPEDRRRAIASHGGVASHAKGTAHEFTPEEAREAGRKGGKIVSRNRAHMSDIGREGGKVSRGVHSSHNEHEGSDQKARGGSQND